MADLLPSSPDVEQADEPRVIGIDDEDADDLIAALSSDTARSILASLHEDPATPSTVADRADTTLQNAQYHLKRLDDAGVIEVADTVYSEKGREMKVYAPADRALVVVAGRDSETTGLRTALSRLIGGVGVLGLAAVALDRLVRRTTGGVSLASQGGAGDADGGDAGAGADGGAATDLGTNATVSTTPEPTPEPTAEPTATSTTASGDGGGFQIAEATPTPSPESEEATRTAAETATRTVAETATSTPAPTATPTPTPTATATSTPTPQPTPEATATVADGATTVAAATDPTSVSTILATASPGTLFFLGGVTVLLAGFVVWYLRARR